MVQNGNTKLNVFAQLTEPKIKEGLWIKTEAVTKIEPKQLSNVPTFRFSSVSASENDIYINSNGQKLYKLNSLTDVFTEIASHSYSSGSNMSICVKDTDVYMFGYGNSNNGACKYNTISKTYTSLSDLYKDFYRGSTVLLGDRIYMMGFKSDSEGKYYLHYYNVSDNKVYYLKNISFTSNGKLCMVGTDVYLVGVNTNRKDIYKYDTITGLFTKILEAPYTLANIYPIAVDTDIFLLGLGIDYSNNYNMAYKLDTITNALDYLGNLPIKLNVSYGSAVAVGKYIYLFSWLNSSDDYVCYKYDTSKVLPELSECKFNNIEILRQSQELINGNLYIIEGNKAKAKLADNIAVQFDTAFLYKDDMKNNYPIFTGNGENWNKV